MVAGVLPLEPPVVEFRHCLRRATLPDDTVTGLLQAFDVPPGGA